MKALFENLKFNSSLYSNEIIRNQYSKTYNFKENIPNNKLNMKRHYGELQNTTKNDNFEITNNYSKIFVGDKEKENVKDERIKKINLESLSEVKNYKTELCHSWELTGTCKYGLNVR